MNTSSMIAYLPTDGTWCKQELPHMTLVYGGKTEGRNASEFNAMAKDAISVGRLTGSFSLAVTGVEEFDEGEDAVDVLTFHPTPQLLVARQLVEHWDRSEFDFNPHATIGPAGSALAMMPERGGWGDNVVPYGTQGRRDSLPMNVYFNRLIVCWNDDKLLFNLNEMY